MEEVPGWYRIPAEGTGKPWPPAGPSVSPLAT